MKYGIADQCSEHLNLKKIVHGGGSENKRPTDHIAHLGNQFKKDVLVEIGAVILERIF